jgi:hypothetical protein
MSLQGFGQVFHEGFKKSFPCDGGGALQNSSEGGLFIEVCKGKTLGFRHRILEIGTLLCSIVFLE